MPRIVRRAFAAVASALAASCLLLPNGSPPVPLPDGAWTLSLAGEFSIQPLGRYPARTDLRFGGISGLVRRAEGREMLGLSDDQTATRVYRISLVGSGTSFAVSILDYFALERPGEPPADLDPEGIVLTPRGELIISSEGLGTVEPRVPPAIVMFGLRGEYLRQIPVRERFLPNPTGPLTKGVRPNFAFEALALTLDGSTLFTASESALVQDGEMNSADHGAPARLLEYVRDGDTYEPRREFVYPVEPVVRPPFDMGLAVSGLVDLIAIDDEQLLGLERTYVEDAANKARGLNTIRLYRISLAGATDVSTIDSLAGAPGVRPVTKTLLLDLAELVGLSPELADGLDNFEAMAVGPTLPDGRPSLLLVSDDNFSPRQRTWFVLLGIGPPGAATQVE